MSSDRNPSVISNGPLLPAKPPRPRGIRVSRIGHRRVGEDGVVTYKNITSSQIMGSIQLGVQNSICDLSSKPDRDVLFGDFMMKEQMYFPNCGSKDTPPHDFSDFRFDAYAPMAFRYFRALFHISPADFLISMCSAPLRELSNPGASGSIFYVTHDDRFIVKTVEKNECKFLLKLLPGYFMNLQQNPGSFLPKFYGLFYYRCNSRYIRLVVMNNLLPSTIQIHQKYDVKGSTFKRKASKAEREKSSPTFKDLDFKEDHPDGILLDGDVWKGLIKSLRRDTQLLHSFKIMDYSLLIGVHNIATATATNTSINRNSSSFSLEDENDGVKNRLSTGSTSSFVASRLPARNTNGEPLLLFVGVIDILQKYGFRKQMEHSFKALFFDGDTVSVHRPGFYARRFMNFAKSVFRKKPALKQNPLRQSSKSPRVVVRRRHPSVKQTKPVPKQINGLLLANRSSTILPKVSSVTSFQSMPQSSAPILRKVQSSNFTNFEERMSGLAFQKEKDRKQRQKRRVTFHLDYQVYEEQPRDSVTTKSFRNTYNE